MDRVVLLPRRARPFFARHPWVFAGSIARVVGDPEPGAEVRVESHEGQFVARGLFNPRSAIRVRLYRWDDVPLDDDYWRARIEAAWRLRAGTLGLDSPDGACRVVFSEADGLSGLTVDRFGQWLVVQITSLALDLRRDSIVPMLLAITGCSGATIRNDRSLAAQEGLPVAGIATVGDVPTGPIEIVEHEIRYPIDLRGGQKTGFYLDQRTNRRAVAAYARGQRVLDLCCYTGGFALNTLKHGGAAHALGFDSSAPAIEAARRTAVANGLGAARFEVADVFETLDRLRGAGQRFGLVVCDPPRFARSASSLEEALRAYLRLNRAAVEVLAPGGILATCSCSGHVDRATFAQMLGQAAELSGRPIQILEARGQAADHPISASCLETEYLKCFICRVA
jgi:23S rRNA (cytosine1962-C5)-methyltransferase